MPESSIAILSSQTDQSYYDSIRLKNSQVEVYPTSAAVDFSNGYAPDLVLLDCGHEVIDGLSVLRDIKIFYPHIPVIFITEVTSDNIAVEAFRCGARDYLKKPVNITELLKSMECIVRIKKRPREQRRSCLMNIYYNEMDMGHTLKESLPPNIFIVIQHIEANLTCQMTLDDLAEIANSSKYHFCKTFKKYIGMSPLKYVVLKRIKRAELLLMYSDMNISEAAWESGFNDLSNFNKHFKKYTGKTPTSYKLQY